VSEPARERLFFALWPDEMVRARLAAQVVPFEGRHVAADNLHLTLAFLGDTDADRRACCERVAGTVPFTPFELVLTDVQWQRRRGIVWMAAHEIPAGLRELVSALNEALAGCGFAPESRPFRAHVTLARKVRRGRPVKSDPIRWWIDRFWLVSSQLQAGGSRYTLERCWPAPSPPDYQ
jgi:2'-5' RNA ligase